MMKKLWPGPVALMFDVPEERREEAAQEVGVPVAELYDAGSITLRCTGPGRNRSKTRAYRGYPRTIVMFFWARGTWTCTATFQVGASVTLKAAAAAGSRFTGWSGDCAGTNANCKLKLSANRAATATFAPR